MAQRNESEQLLMLAIPSPLTERWELELLEGLTKTTEGWIIRTGSAETMEILEDPEASDIISL